MTGGSSGKALSVFGQTVAGSERHTLSSGPSGRGSSGEDEGSGGGETSTPHDKQVQRLHQWQLRLWWPGFHRRSFFCVCVFFFCKM